MLNIENRDGMFFFVVPRVKEAVATVNDVWDFDFNYIFVDYFISDFSRLISFSKSFGGFGLVYTASGEILKIECHTSYRTRPSSPVLTAMSAHSSSIKYFHVKF